MSTLVHPERPYAPVEVDEANRQLLDYYLAEGYVEQPAELAPEAEPLPEQEADTTGGADAGEAPESEDEDETEDDGEDDEDDAGEDLDLG